MGLMICAVAGRRIDSPGAQDRRFPLENVEMVRRGIRDLFVEHSVSVLVSSAACGADLLALEEAGRLRLRRRVVLPFDRELFRRTSVTDRPGDWGRLYDRIIHRVSAGGDLVTLGFGPEGEEAYRAVNRVILDEAQRLAEELQEKATAVLVWDGQSRGEADVTEAFGEEASKRGLRVLQVRTVGTAGAA